MYGNVGNPLGTPSSDAKRVGELESGKILTPVPTHNHKLGSIVSSFKLTVLHGHSLASALTAQPTLGRRVHTGCSTARGLGRSGVVHTVAYDKPVVAFSYRQNTVTFHGKLVESGNETNREGTSTFISKNN